MLHASLNASGLRQRVMFVVKNILIYYQAITYGCLKKIKMIDMSIIIRYIIIMLYMLLLLYIFIF